MTDPWKHRSAGMTCATCMWFAEKVAAEPAEYSEISAESVVAGATPVSIFGRCRRHAPTMQGYPAVFGKDWCGDHKLDENKR